MSPRRRWPADTDDVTMPQMKSVSGPSTANTAQRTSARARPMPLPSGVTTRETGHVLPCGGAGESFHQREVEEREGDAEQQVHAALGLVDGVVDGDDGAVVALHLRGVVGREVAAGFAQHLRPRVRRRGGEEEQPEDDDADGGVDEERSVAAPEHCGDVVRGRGLGPRRRRGRRGRCGRRARPRCRRAEVGGTEAHGRGGRRCGRCVPGGRRTRRTRRTRRPRAGRLPSPVRGSRSAGRCRRGRRRTRARSTGSRPSSGTGGGRAGRGPSGPGCRGPAVRPVREPDLRGWSRVQCHRLTGRGSGPHREVGCGRPRRSAPRAA